MKRNVLLERILDEEIDQPRKYIREKLSGESRYRALVQLAEKYRSKGKTEKAEELIDELKDMVNVGDTRERIKIFIMLSDYYRNFEENEAAEYLSKARSNVSKIQNENEKIDTLTSLVGIYGKNGNSQRAEEMINEVLGFIDRVDERTAIGALKEISNYYFDMGDRYTSIEILEETKNIADRIDPDHDKGDALIDIADGFSSIGAKDRARKTLKVAARETEKCSDAWKRADMYSTLAIFFHEMDGEGNSESFLRKAEENVQKINYEWREVDIFALITSEYGDINQKKYKNLLEKTLEIAKGIKVKKSKSLALYHIVKRLGNLEEDRGEFSDLWKRGKELIEEIENPADRKELKERYDISDDARDENDDNPKDGQNDDRDLQEIKDPWERINLLYERFNEAYQNENEEKQKKYFNKIVDLSKKVKTYWNRDDSYLYIVEMASKISNGENKVMDVKRMKLPEKITDPWRRAKSFVHIARYFKRKNKTDAVRKYLEKSLGSAEDIDYSWRKALALRYLSSGHEKTGDKERAGDLYNRSCRILERYDGERRDRILNEFEDVYGFDFFR